MRIEHIKQCAARPELKLIAEVERLQGRIDKAKSQLDGGNDCFDSLEEVVDAVLQSRNAHRAAAERVTKLESDLATQCGLTANWIAEAQGLRTEIEGELYTSQRQFDRAGEPFIESAPEKTGDEERQNYIGMFTDSNVGDD